MWYHIRHPMDMLSLVPTPVTLNVEATTGTDLPTPVSQPLHASMPLAPCRLLVAANHAGSGMDRTVILALAHDLVISHHIHNPDRCHDVVYSLINPWTV